MSTEQKLWRFESAVRKGFLKNIKDFKPSERGGGKGDFRAVVRVATDTCGISPERVADIAVVGISTIHRWRKGEQGGPSPRRQSMIVDGIRAELKRPRW